MPTSQRATSRSRTVEPSALVRRMTDSNWSVVCSSVRAVIVALSCWPVAAGLPPNWPAETCAFWAWSAATTSFGVIR